MSGFGWVTLATNDTYSLGALVLAHSLRRVGTIYQLVVMVTPGVTQSMRDKLRSVFDLVFEVNILDSKDERNLLLLQRPELGITFTKLHCWRLTQYIKCVFLDADTLVLQNCDELFDRDELSAAPDVGWPDCFNSGVFVYTPSEETFNSLLAFALERGSFDGGDQGLLNLYFSDWAHTDINKHLPFIYNMCSTACYSYLPAFKQFGENVKIVHFIGNSKPWLQYFNSETLQVSCSPNFEHLQVVFELWWNLFCVNVHSNLQSKMARINTSIASSCTSSSHSFAYFLNESKCEDSLCTEQFCGTDVTDIPVWDPWEYYQPINSVDLVDSNSKDISNLDINSESNSNLNFVENNENKTEFSFHKSYNYNTKSYNDNVISNVNKESIECNSQGNSSYNFKQQIENVSNISTECNSQGNSSHNFKQKIENVSNISLVDHPPNTCIYSKTPPIQSPPTYQSITPTVLCDANSISTEQPALASNSEPRIESNGGLAGAFAQMTLRQPRSASQDALEDHLRRQGWEAGRIDYLGQDSFDNVWRKICETMAAAPKKEPSPPKQATVESLEAPLQLTEAQTSVPATSTLYSSETLSAEPATSTPVSAAESAAQTPLSASLSTSSTEFAATTPILTSTTPASAAEPVTSATPAAEPAVVSTPTSAATPAPLLAPVAEAAVPIPTTDPAVTSALASTAELATSATEPLATTASVSGTELTTPLTPAAEPVAVSVPASNTESSTFAVESAAVSTPVPDAEPTIASAPTAESASVPTPVLVAEPTTTPTLAVELTAVSVLVPAPTVLTPTTESATVSTSTLGAESATAFTSATKPAAFSVAAVGSEFATAPILATEPVSSPISAVEPATAPPAASESAAASASAPGVEQVAIPVKETAPTPTAEPSTTVTELTSSLLHTSAPISELAKITQKTPHAASSETVTTVKPEDVQSSTTPVPPPRKSGKNGAGAKKTAKKK